MVFLCICAAVLLLVLLLSYVCYRMAFYSPARKPLPEDAYPIPEGSEYEPYREQMIQWIRRTRDIPHEEVTVRSFDGLTLCGYFYEYAPGAPVELMMHGYRGTPERDLCGGVLRCFRLRRSALVVDQRACGKSDGHVITFGIHEHKDCLTWVDYLTARLGRDCQILLTGISMGAATVLMAGGRELPPQVKGIIADCGYTSPKAIIQKVIVDMRLPPRLSYPFVRLGARLYGGFDLEEFSPIASMKTCRVPVFFIHGQADDFVPCRMSEENAAVCAAEHRLFTVPGAGHGLSYLLDTEGYHRAIEQMGFPAAEGN